MDAEKRKACIEKVKKYFEKNPDEWTDAVKDLNAFNGCLGSGERFSMDDFNKLMAGKSPLDIARMIADGDDEDGSYCCFNPDRSYFYFDCRGNLVSCDEKDYSGYLYNDLVAEYIDRRGDLLFNRNVEEIISKYDDEE